MRIFLETADGSTIYSSIPDGYAVVVVTVGKNLKRLRELLKMTQEGLATSADVTQAAISKYETGRADPDVSSLLKLAAGLGMPVNELVAGVHEPYDRICHVSAEGSGLQKGGPASGSASLTVERRLVSQVTDLRARIKEYRTALDQTRHAAHRILAVTDIREQDDAPESAPTGRSGRHRKTS